MLWITMATLLATSRILKEVDEKGMDIAPKAEFAGGQPRFVKRSLSPILVSPNPHVMQWTTTFSIQDQAPFRGS